MTGARCNRLMADDVWSPPAPLVTGDCIGHNTM